MEGKMERKEIVTRSAQNPKDCWAVEDIFPTEAAWEAGAGSGVP